MQPLNTITERIRPQPSLRGLLALHGNIWSVLAHRGRERSLPRDPCSLNREHFQRTIKRPPGSGRLIRSRSRRDRWLKNREHLRVPACPALPWLAVGGGCAFVLLLISVAWRMARAREPASG